MLKLFDDTALEHEYEENQHATENVVNIENCFNYGAMWVLRDDFQDPWYTHYSEELEVHDKTAISNELFDQKLAF